MTDVDAHNMIATLQQIADELAYLREAKGEVGYTIAESLEMIALTMMQQQQEKGQ